VTGTAALDAGAAARRAPPPAGSVLALLAAQAAARPDAVALVEEVGARRRAITFAAFDRRVRQMQAWLEAQGLRAGDGLLVFHPPSIDLYVTLVALFRLGGVAMFVDLGAGRGVLEAACRLHPPAAVLLSPKAHLLRLVSAALRRIPRRFTGGRWPVPGARRIAGAARLAPTTRAAVEAPDAPALMTFTSGSTGVPKAAVRTHAFLQAQHRALSATVGAPGGMVDVVAFPVVVLANLASGATSVLPAGDLRRPGAVDPAPLLAQLAAERPTRLSAPPAMLARLVAPSAADDARWRSVREIVTGGGPVFPDLLDALARVAPGAECVAVYGSTEAEPIAEQVASAIGAADRARMAGGAGLLAGAPVAPVRLRVIAPPEAALADALASPLDPAAFDALEQPRGEVGEIVVAGAHVLQGYWRGVGDAETKLRVGGEVWHRTGDLGRLDADGRLWLLGRAAAAITDARGAVYPFAVECALRTQWPGLRSALVADRERRVLVVESADAPSDAELRATLAWTTIDDVVRVRRIPLDGRHNSKIDYPGLRRLLARGRPGGRLGDPGLAGGA
jgi:acyl-CoA synthetase (AMP-forming)/AMP-acid ligase II